jgi:hypothetical protein
MSIDTKGRHTVLRERWWRKLDWIYEGRRRARLAERNPLVTSDADVKAV